MPTKDKWNELYAKHRPGKLPWYGIRFPDKVREFLSSLDKNHLLVVPGCGTGETAAALSGLGFTKIIGTDISDKAIEIASMNFPNIQFIAVPTEGLHKQNTRNANVFDWLNLHQISPGNLGKYLEALDVMGSNVLLAYVYEPEKGKSSKSYVHGGSVHNHEPKRVESFFRRMRKADQFEFRIRTNPRFGKVRTHKAICQIYSMKPLKASAERRQ